MKVLTVLMRRDPGFNGVLCRGIYEDETVFENILFPNADDAIKTIGARWRPRLDRVIFDLPKGEPR